MSPLSLGLAHVGYLPGLWILFHPTLREAALALAVDFLAFGLMAVIDRKLFLRLYPDTAYYFPKLRMERIASFGKTERIELFRSLVRFPSRRAGYVSLMSLLKVQPSNLVITFAWQHGGSNLSQYLLVSSLSLIILAYFYGVIFIEQHIHVSNALAMIHEKLDWGDVFASIQLPDLKVDFERQEILTLGTIALFVFSLQAVLVGTADGPSRLSLALSVLAIGILGIMLFSRVWFLGRNFFFGGLNTLFEAFNQKDPSEIRTVLPLHSAPVLARFELTFNALVARLQGNEQELSHWIARKTDESRYQALGEITGLVAHDLSNPLQVIDYCAKELPKDHPEPLRGRLLKLLEQNSSQALDLVRSLRNYLRTPGSASAESEFIEGHNNSLRLLGSRFYTQGFSNIRIDVSPEVAGLRLGIHRGNLIHILLNLYGNSIRNLLEHKVPNPWLRIEKGPSNPGPGRATILIRDNGTGLNPGRFELLTGHDYLSAGSPVRQEGLGLRLVRRLTEREGGSLECLPVKQGESGTILALTLRLADPKEETGKHSGPTLPGALSG